jgi:hypothetical protein
MRSYCKFKRKEENPLPPPHLLLLEVDTCSNRIEIYLLLEKLFVFGEAEAYAVAAL